MSSASYLKQYDSGFGQDWISTSSLSTLMRCGIQWEYAYVHRIKSPGSVRLVAGLGAHGAREVAMRSKIVTKVDVAENVCTDAARDTAVAEFDRQEIALEPEFADKSLPDARGIAVDKATAFALADRKEFHPRIENPIATEEMVAVNYAGLKRVIVGKVDLVELTQRSDVIVDLKSSKVSKSQDFADSNMGISTYGMAWLAKTGKAPMYRIHALVDLKAGVKCQELETTRTQEELQKQLERFAAAERTIQTGVFMPANPESWWCCAAYCGYWNRCKYWSGR
jgi:hypothetical protein